LEYVGYQSCDELPAVDVPSQMLLSGLLMMADWIASNSYYAPLIPLEESFDNAIYPQRIDELWDKLALPDQWLPYNSFMDEEAFKERYGFLPNAMQRAMLQIAENADSSGIYIIEAQMGLGKTEAALSATEVLAAKWSLEGVFFGLPTQATANGIFPRMKAWVESMTDGNRFSIKLIHENAMLQKDYRELLLQGSATQNEDAEDGGLIVHNWFEGRKQALLTSFVIGTVDQMLMAALQQKHVMLRHLGLAGKVVIVDECHAYDAYMNCYLERALEWLGMYDIPVILLSATLPSQRRVKLMEAYHGGKFKTTSDKWKNNQAYPLITYTDGDEIKQCEVPVDTKSKRIVISKSSLNDVAPILKERLLHGGSAGVILNTVNQAQKTAELLQREFPDYEVVLLHARFTMADRQGLEEKVLQSLGKHSVPKERQLIVVGTQILEQSLDIDFDVMITQLAPMDLLLQRIGRLHRHEGRVRPKLLQAPICFVTDCGELDEGSKLIYGEWLLRRTNELLTDAIELPKDISPLVQETYRVLEEDSGLYECWQEQVNKQKIKEGKAKAHRILSKKELDETMHGLLNPHLGNREADALAQVRDGESAISVLLMVSKDEGYVEFLPWQSRGELLSMDHVPAAEECRKILLQKVQLPRLFSVYKYNACVSELEKLNIERLLEWQRSPWLKGELVLLLDENLSAELCGYRLQYSKQRGLVYEKEDQDGGERV
jgi:CRISPR-associated endonuclease/helicase Cas3